MFKKLKLKKKKGFTLIEILLVVGFIALAGIGVYVVYDKVQTQNIVREEVRNIQTLSAGLMTLYQNSPNFNNISPKVAIDAKLVPDNMISADRTQIINRFGNAVTIAPALINNVPVFRIGYNSPTNICPHLVISMMATGVNVASGLTVLSIDNKNQIFTTCTATGLKQYEYGRTKFR